MQRRSFLLLCDSPSMPCIVPHAVLTARLIVEFLPVSIFKRAFLWQISKCLKTSLVSREVGHFLEPVVNSLTGSRRQQTAADGSLEPAPNLILCASGSHAVSLATSLGLDRDKPNET